MDDYQKVQALLEASESITLHGATRIEDQLQVDVTSEGRRAVVVFSAQDVARIAAQYVEP